MDVDYADKRLRAIKTDSAARELRLPHDVIIACRRKLVVLESAPDERTLRNWKSLHYEKLKGARSNERSIRVNDQWRIVFEIDTTVSPNRILILSIEDYH